MSLFHDGYGKTKRSKPKRLDRVNRGFAANGHKYIALILGDKKRVLWPTVMKVNCRCL